MKDRGLLMTRANRVAIEEGRKGMTRRLAGLDVINAEPNRWRLDSFKDGVARFVDKKDGTVVDIKAPYAVGQRLYLKEALQDYHGRAMYYRHNYSDHTIVTPRLEWKWKRNTLNARFMPKVAARTWLMVTEAKAPERGKDISEADAIAEGICETGKEIKIQGKLRMEYPSFGYAVTCLSAVASFGILLESIYGEGAMEKWYWPISFDKIEKE